jgi:signal transduction histidine kinase
VDDDEGVCAELVGALRDDYEIEIAHNGPSAIQRLTSRLPDAIVTDVDLPIVSGIDLVAMARGIDSSLPLLIITETETLDAAMEAMRLGAYDYLMKPLASPAAVRRTVARALESAALRRENARLLEDLKEAGAFKGRLMRAVSHDFKNLLTVVLGYARLAQLHPDSEMVPECLEHIMNTSRIMAVMAEDLGTYSQIDARALKLSPARTSLLECGRAAVNALFYDPAVHRVILPEDDLEVFADRHRTTQILANLLGNAVKYSPRGGEVRIHAVRRNGTVEVSVSDQGLGIPEADIERLFRPFFRLQRDAQSGIPGTGLGLTIVQSLVTAQKGRIWATSQEGVGTTFTFTVPAYQQE